MNIYFELAQMLATQALMENDPAMWERAMMRLKTYYEKS